jgi:DNA-binding MarR family transcriptional regulator
MSKIDAARLWSLNYRVLSAIITGVAPELEAMGLETKELFILAAIDEHPHPAALAEVLCMPKPTVTVYLKRLESVGLVKREIDPADLRRHRLSVTAAGRKLLVRGQALLSEAYGLRLARLNAAEQAQLAGLLEKLG